MSRATILCTPGYANWLKKFGEPRDPRSAHAWAFKQTTLTTGIEIPRVIKFTFEYVGHLPLWRR